jgi:hypothetical protein
VHNVDLTTPALVTSTKCTLPSLALNAAVDVHADIPASGTVSLETLACMFELVDA